MAKKSSADEEEKEEPGPSTSGRIIPGLANMVPVLRNGKNGPVMIPTAVRRVSVGEALVKKAVEKERAKERKKKLKAPLVEMETQTSPGMWGGQKKKK